MTAARGFLGAGDLYISRYDPTTAAFLAYEGPYLAEKFEIKPNSDLKEMSSRGKTTYGQVIESVPLPKPTDFTVELTEVDTVSLATALFGTSTTLTQASGTLTAEAFTVIKGKWVQLSKQRIDPADTLVVTHTTGSPTYVEGTDYEVNRTLGMVKILTGSAIVDGASVKFTGDYLAISGTTIAGSTQSQVRAKFKLDGVNFADQSPCIVFCREAVLTPDNAFDFLGSDFAKISLKGRLKTPTGQTDPFTVELRTA